MQGENERQWKKKKSEQETRKVQSGSFTLWSCKTTAEKCTKKVCCTCKVAFLLIRPIVVFPPFSGIPLPLIITRFYILFEQTINIIETLAFSPGSIYILWNVFVYETIKSNLLRTMILVGRVLSVVLEKKNNNNNNNNRLRQILLTTCRSSDLLFSCRTTSSTCNLPQKSLTFGGPHEWRKGDITRDDSQRWFLVQHSIAMLEGYCNHLNQCRNNVATPCCAKNHCCESSRATSP